MATNTRKTTRIMGGTARNGAGAVENKGKTGNGSTGEGKIMGMNALAKLAGNNDVVSRSKASSTRPQEDEARKSPTDPTSIALQDALEQQEKIHLELDSHRDRLRHQETELRAYEAEKERSAEQQRQGERTISTLESKLASETRETAYWTEKHEDIHRRFLRTESEYRILQDKMADRNEMWKREWERKNEHLLTERDRCRDGYQTAQRVVDEMEEENQELRRQVLELKHSISTSTRTEGQVTDDVFREKIRNLGHDVQNWTINNFRRKDIGIISHQLCPTLG